MSLKQAVLGGGGGSLRTATSEELQSRTTTPMGGAMQGQSPHQTKMAGTPNQKENALSLKGAYQDTLQRQQRLAPSQMGAQKSEAEQRAFEKSQSLEALGGLGDRVDQLINTEVAGLVDMEGLAARDAKGIEEAGFQLAGETTYEDVATAVQGLASGDLAALATLNEALGKEPSAPLTIEELKMLYQDVDDSIVANLAAQMPDQISVTDELAQSLGFEGGIGELSEILGMTEAELQGMNVLQLDEAAERLKAEEFNRVEELKARLSNPNISPAERQSLVQELRSMGVTGVRATERDVEKTIEAIEEGQTVQWGDQEYALEDILDDEELSGIIKRYLTNPESTELPDGIKQFIEDNRGTLEDAADDLDEDVEEFATVQEENLAIKSVDENVPDIDGDVMDLILGKDWEEQFRGDRLMDDEELMSEYPGLKMLHDEGGPWEADEKLAIVSNLNSMAASDPDLAKQILQLTPQELQKLGLQRTPNTALTDFINQRKTVKQLERLGDDAKLDEILDIVFGREVNSKQLKNVYTEMQWAKGLGLELPKEYKQFSKWIGNPQAMMEQIKKAGQIGDIRKFKKSLVSPPNLEGMSQSLKAQLKSQKLSRFGHFVRDGVLDAKNINDIARDIGREGKTDQDQWNDLNQLLKAPALNKEGRAALKAQISKMQKKSMSRALNKIYGGGWRNVSEKFLSKVLTPGHPGSLNNDAIRKLNRHLKELELRGELPGNSRKKAMAEIKARALKAIRDRSHTTELGGEGAVF